MIKVSGITVDNFPEGYDNRLNELLLGELHSSKYHFIKTPTYVFGRDIDEIREFVNNIKKIDSMYDTVFIYDAVENNDREHIKTIKI